MCTAEWPKSKTLETPTTDKDVKQLELSVTAGGNAASPSEDTAAPYKANNRFITQSSKSIPH